MLWELQGFGGGEGSSRGGGGGGVIRCILK